MAVFRKMKGKRGVRWQAVVRKRGHHLCRTFDRSDHAKAWAAAVESAITNASVARPFNPENWLHEAAAEREARAAAALLGDAYPAPHPAWTLGRACRHYRETVTPTKKGEKAEGDRLLRWEAHPLAGKRMGAVTAADIQVHIDARLAAGRATTTVRNEVFLLSAVYEQARANPRPNGGGGWGLADLGNPTRECVLPAPPRGRNRRLEAPHEDDQGEEERLRQALAEGLDGPEMVALFTLAIETGMRLGEMLDIRRGEVRSVRGARLIRRGDSKNADARQVTLSSRAWAAMEPLLAGGGEASARVFTLRRHAVENRWVAARRRAEVADLHFHDLRHEGLSRMAGAGLTIGELKAQSGHKTAQVLLTYVNARPTDIAKKLG